jgi:hypothetical protein
METDNAISHFDQVMEKIHQAEEKFDPESTWYKMPL